MSTISVPPTARHSRPTLRKTYSEWTLSTIKRSWKNAIDCNSGDEEPFICVEKSPILDSNEASLLIKGLPTVSEHRRLNDPVLKEVRGDYSEFNDYLLFDSFKEMEQLSAFWDSFIHTQSNRTHNLKVQKEIRSMLFEKVKSRPIPFNQRANVWSFLCGAKLEESKRIYGSLCKRSRYDDIINMDIMRTFPCCKMFQDGAGGQKKMFKILRAYSNYDKEVGYCQGLSFLVGVFLMQNMSEETAFAVLLQLMGEIPDQKYIKHSPATEIYKIRKLYKPDLSGLHLYLFQLSALLLKLKPKLFHHLEKLGVTVSMYACQWFLTCFSYSLPFHLVFRIFDLMFIEGIQTIVMRVALALLGRNEDIILGKNEFEQVLSYLKNELLSIYQPQEHNLICDVVKMSKKVTPDLLFKLETKYQEEEVQCGITVSKRELDFMKARNEYFQQQLELLEDKIERYQSTESALLQKIQDLELKLNAQKEM